MIILLLVQVFYLKAKGSLKILYLIMVIATPYKLGLSYTIIVIKIDFRFS